VKEDLEIQTGKINFLEKEFQDISVSDKGNHEVSWFKFFVYDFALLFPIAYHNTRSIGRYQGPYDIWTLIRPN